MDIPAADAPDAGEPSRPATVQDAEDLLVEVLDDAERRSTDPNQLERTVNRALWPLVDSDSLVTEPATDPVGVVLRGATWAVRYRFDRKDRRMKLSPRLELGDDDADPPRVRDVTEEVVDSWERLAERVSGAAVRARLFHLLFERRRGNGRDRASAAVRGYLDLVEVWRRESLVEPLAAALDLARSTGQYDLAAEVLGAVEAVARESIASERHEPAVVLGFLRILVEDPDRPGATAELLDLVQGRYDDARSVDHVLSMKLKCAGDAGRRRELYRERVALWLDEANATEGVLKAVYLERAVEIADKSEDRGLWEEATARLQRIRDEDIQMIRFTTGQRLRFEEVEEYLRSVLDAESMSEALDAFVLLGPVTGDFRRNRETVEDQQRSFPLSSLFPPRRVDGDGLPRFTPSTDEERFEFHLAATETMHITFSAGLIAEALDRIRQRFGIPTVPELTRHFARNPIVPLSVATALARSFQRWWAGDGEGAGYTALPRIETLARNLLLAEDAALYRLQRGHSSGGYAGLGQLLDALATTGLNPDWHRFLRTLLASPSGMNIRNEVLHGYHDIELVNAALVLQAVGYLALLTPRPRTRNEGETEDTPDDPE
jgi:hypothetical protein